MIGVVVQKGGFVYVYDDKNHQLCTMNGELYGYTSSTFSVKRNSMIYTYDEKGHLKSSQAAR